MPLKRIAGQAFNILPDRMNLFMRYMTHVGNEGLELDESTLRSLRQATERNRLTDEGVEFGQKTQEERQKYIEQNFPKGATEQDFVRRFVEHGPGVPMSGPVSPYAGKDKGVTQTLGRFTATVNPDGSIRMQDTYDMENENEDPDLVTGKFQPRKALLKLRGIYDNEARAQLLNQVFRETGQADRQVMRPPMDNRSYGEKISTAGSSSTSSPLSEVARAAMYLAPFKPKPFDIDITLPPTSR